LATKNSLKNCSQDGAGCLLPPLLGLLPVLQEGVVVLTLWDVLGSITLLGDLVVDKSELATLLSGRDSVQADVELSTVVRVRVLGVGVELTELISRSLLGTSEPVVGLVSISLESFVTKVTPTEVSAKQNENHFSVRYGTLVWCAGIKPHDFVKDFGFQMNERGTQILVDATLKVKGEEDIYALGDCCTIEDYWLPQTAQVANQQGQFLAKLLSGRVPSGSKSPFVFKSKGMMAYLGGFSAVMSKLPGLNKMTGFVAFLGWRFTYWFLQLSVRNRFMLLTDWLRTLVFGRDLTRFGRRSTVT